MSTRSTAREHTLGGISNLSILWDGLSCACGCRSSGPQRGGGKGGVQGGMTASVLAHARPPALERARLFPRRRREVMDLLEAAGFSKSNPYYVVKQGKVRWVGRVGVGTWVCGWWCALQLWGGRAGMGARRRGWGKDSHGGGHRRDGEMGVG